MNQSIDKRTSYSTPSRQYKQPTEYKVPSEVRTSDTQKMTSVPKDKLATLKAYRRAKGLCYICGERWGKDHKCNNTLQLHVVQELLEVCATNSVDSDDSEVDLMVLSAETQTAGPANSVIRLTCQVAGQEVIFLLDSGSLHSFLSDRLASQLAGQQRLSKMQWVRIAGGGQLVCFAWIPKSGWSVGGHRFVTDFKILPLQHYDGIIGMDWLSAQGTMSVNWLQKWLSFDYKDSKVVLQGDPPSEFEFTIVELQLIRETQETKVTVLEDVPEEIQQVIASFADIFEESAGLPPRRSCDHKIPLVEGARHVNIRPYRYSPEQKTEIERQVKEMLASGVILPSTSPFASPIILVKTKDGTWRLCVDYRQLKMLTLKTKYPLPMIDELLDELSGASWFSKLDLRAGYHRIHLAPGEEYKTAFHTHNGHYEFNVVSFGLTGGPSISQGEMNITLALVDRVCAVVFFDDILVFSATLEEHVQHLKQGLQLLRQHQWRVKESKCAFAQRSISYLGLWSVGTECQ